MGRKEQLYRDAQRYGLRIGEWSPGDGVTRYRFMYDPTVRIDPTPLGAHYDGIPARKVRGTWLGISEAETALLMYSVGYTDGKAEGYEQGCRDVLYGEEVQR